MIDGLQQLQAFSSVSPSPADRLADSEVRKFFLGVLSSDLSAEQKYDRFVEFFRLDASLARKFASHAHELKGQTEETIERVLATVAQDAGVWKPDEILSEMRDSLVRAVGRLLVSQHRDGGWGYQPEVSSVWATAYGSLSLHVLERHHLVDRDLRQAYERGLGWLVAHRDDWSVAAVPPGGKRSVYEVSVVIRCLATVGRSQDPEVAEVISDCLTKLEESQNDDGGWDHSVWGPEWPGPVRIWSDTGATGFALQALAMVGGERCCRAVTRGIECLAAAQNEDDGSWNVMLARNLLDRGARSVTKTCDALKGILAGSRAGVDLTLYRQKIARAVEFLQSREQPIFNEARNITGWGWHSDELSTIENTCQTLETLLLMKDASLPLLASNATWLLRSQLKAAGSPDDGKWANDDAGRITLSLLQFYKAIKTSPLFGSAQDDV